MSGSEKRIPLPSQLQSSRAPRAVSLLLHCAAAAGEGAPACAFPSRGGPGLPWLLAADTGDSVWGGAVSAKRYAKPTFCSFEAMQVSLAVRCARSASSHARMRWFLRETPARDGARP